MLAENAKAAGITISSATVDISDRLRRATASGRSRSTTGSGLPYLVVASIADGPGANAVNVTHFNDPKFNALYLQAAKQLDQKKRCGIVHEMQQIQYERGGYIIWSFQNTVDAYSTKLGGITAGRRDGVGSRPLPASQAVLRLTGRARDADGGTSRDRVRADDRPAGAVGPGAAHSTARWVLRRIVLSLFVLLGVSVLVFVATQALPGDPAVQILGRSAQPAQLAALRHELGLDRSLPSQYAHWLGNLLRGSLGHSLASSQSVGSLLLDRALASLTLVLLSAMIAIPLALLIGTLGAVRRDRPLDHVAQTGLLVLTALPDFVIGLVLLIVLSISVVKLLPAVALVPPGRRRDPRTRASWRCRC